MKQLGVIDTDATLHVARGDSIWLIKEYFEPIYLDEFNDGEFNNHCEKDGVKTNLPNEIEVIKRASLIDRGIISLYNSHLEDMRYLFTPQDEGEKRAIALVKALGGQFLITDDMKPDGPYKTVNNGMCGEIIALSSTDLICLQYLSRGKSIEDIIEIYEPISLNAYEEGRAPSLKGAIKNFLEWIVASDTPFIHNWFNEWLNVEGVENKRVSQLASDAKHL